jgi:hypothetical protein
MPNNPQKQRKYFTVLNSTGKRQVDFDTPMADATLNRRHNCTIQIENVRERETVYDCSQQDIHEETVDSQLKRITITYASVTADFILMWLAYFLSAAAAPTGTAQNEVQTITVDATAGTFPLSFDFEGLSGTTPQLPFNANAATVQAALEKLRPIKEGNVVCAGALATGMTVTFQGDLAKANVPMLTTSSAALTGNTHTASIVQTTAGGNKYHALTRSTDDDLAHFSAGTGYDDASAADPDKLSGLTCNQIVITLNKRKNVTLQIVSVGKFETDDLVGFTVPDCENLPALKGRDCRIKIDGNWVTEDLWQATITLNNNIPTGDDAFPFDDVNPDGFQRGEKPTYSLALQILGSKGDAVYTLCEDESKVDVEAHLGKPGDRASVIFPTTLMKFGSNPTQFVGELNRSAIVIDASPHKDATLKAPLRAEGYIDQTTAFLTT